MKMRIRTLCCLSLFCFTAVFAQEKFGKHPRPHFTVVKQNAITPVKDQNRSGTCWDFATLGFFESEILRKTGRTYNLCEMFVVNKDYMDCATHYVRMHGLSDFTEGGSADDVLDVLRTHGICPEEAMPLPGSLVGDTLANFETFFPMLSKVVVYFVSCLLLFPFPSARSLLQVRGIPFRTFSVIHDISRHGGYISCHELWPFLRDTTI